MGVFYSLPETTLVIPHVYVFLILGSLKELNIQSTFKPDRRNTAFQKVRKESLFYKNEQFKTTLLELTYKFSAILIIIPAKFLIDICYGQSVDILSIFIC